jgi:outer membrane protein
MSARRIFAAALAALPLGAQAFDPAFPFEDPLWTRPPVLESGATLPGDAAPAVCPAAPDLSQPLALADAVDLALCNNPQIKAAWASIKLQAGAVGEARAAYLPTITATASRLRTRTAYPDSHVSPTETYGHTHYGSFGWRLFDFGGREANREAANNLLAAAIASHDAALQKTLGAVVQSYFEAQTARAAVQARERSRQIAQSTLDSAQRREARGVASRSDVLQAGTALAKATLEGNRAAGDYRKALSVLVYTLGIDPKASVNLAEEADGVSAEAVEDLKGWLAAAQKDHPTIVAARAQWEAAKKKIVATRSEGLPTIDFSANAYGNGYPGQGLSATSSRVNTIGVAVTIPFFDGFSRTYKIRGAQAQAEQREAELQDTEHNVLMEVVKAHADATASLQNLEASERLLQAARESLSSSQRKYERGAADILEILNTQAALSDAQLERIRSLSEWRSARLRLMANAGQMGRTQVGGFKNE